MYLVQFGCNKKTGGLVVIITVGVLGHTLVFSLLLYRLSGGQRGLKYHLKKRFFFFINPEIDYKNRNIVTKQKKKKN